MTTLVDILWPKSILLADYPTIVKNWVFPLFVGLLSLSMPLVITNMQRVEEKYKKHATFKGVLRNCYVRWYKWSMIIIVIAVLIYLAQMPRILNCGPLNCLVDYSAEILLIIAAVNLLASVIALSYFFLKYTINTPAMYESSKTNLYEYFKEASKLSNVDNDTTLADKYELSTLMAVIEKAFEEQNEVATNDIIADFRKAIAYYRSNRTTSARHISVDYPLTFRTMICDLVQSGIDTGKKSTQEQVRKLLHVIFFDDPAQYGDIPKYGLSYSTLQTIFRIIIDTIDRKHTEFVKIYWSEIFEYTRQMFYAQVIIAPNDCMPESIDRYTLTDEDKKEQALIAYMHFMLQAYLYEKKEYDTLCYTLEYYNTFRTVQCLNFLSIDSALRAYCSVGLNNEKLYYSNPNIASETDNRDYILANYMSFIANYNYNATKDIPVSTPNVVKMSLSESRRLEEAFKTAVTLPGIRFNRIEVQKTMSIAEYTEFLKSLGERNEHEELAFIQKKPLRNSNLELLYKFIKDYLSFGILRHPFVWNLLLDGIELQGIRKTKVGVECSNTFAKELMVYEDNQAELPNKGFEIVQNYLSAIDEKIVIATYAKLSDKSAKEISIEALHLIIQKMANTDRMIFFYKQKKSLEELAKKMGYLYDNQRDYISPAARNLYKCIKCVKLNGSNTKTNALENQIWILPYDQQPFARFIEVTNKQGWESIHQYGGLLFDKTDEWFIAMPHYVKTEEPVKQQEFPIAQLSLKCRIEIIEAKNMKPQIYRIEGL